MSHTPGPWKMSHLDYRAIEGPDGLVVADIRTRSMDDSALIAAAPDLLGFAKWLVKNLPPNTECPFTACLACEAHGKASALIVKAGGR